MDAADRIETFRRKGLPVFASCPGYPIAVEFIAWLERETPEVVAIDDVGKALGREVSFEDALWTMTILANGVLAGELHFEEDDGSMTILPGSAMSAIMDGRPMTHPITGDVVEDASKRSYLRFRLRDPEPEAPAPGL